MSNEPGPGSTFGGFLFADLRGYTAFVESRGDSEAVELLRRYRAIVREVVASFDGAEIRTEGDSFYVVFPSASRAVRAGLAIVGEAARATDADPAFPIRAGVGIHAGETASTDEGPVGSAVNLAARICAQARAGEVLVSDTIRGLTRTSGQFTFTAIGAKKLKGIDEPVTLYRARATDDLPTVAAGSRRRRLVALVAGALFLVLAIGASLFAIRPAATNDRIVFSWQVPLPGNSGCGPGEDAKLQLLDPTADDATPYRLTAATDLYELRPAAAADGSAVYFSGWAGNRDSGVFQVNPGTREADVVEALGHSAFAAPGELAASANGALVAWIDFQGRVVIARVDGTSTVSIPAGTDPPAEPASQLAFLPNDRLLILSATAGTAAPQGQLATIAPDGSDRQVIPAELGEGEFANLGASADGTRAVLSRATESSFDWFVVDLTNASMEPIELPADSRDPAWSPDGTRLVLSSGTPDAQLVEVTLADGGTRQLTQFAGTSACAPQWIPAGPVATLPAATPLPSGAPMPFEIGYLIPGRYAITTFQPNMEMTVGTGWYARRNWVDGWSIADGEATGELDSGRIQVGLLGPCGTEGQVALGGAPTDVVSWVSSRDDLRVSEPAPINIGGYTGLAVNVDTTPGTACPEYPDDPTWALFPLGDDQAWLGPDEVVRIEVIDVNGRSVAFLIFSSRDDAEKFGLDSQAVLATVEFSEP